MRFRLANAVELMNNGSHEKMRASHGISQDKLKDLEEALRKGRWKIQEV